MTRFHASLLGAALCAGTLAIGSLAHAGPRPAVWQPPTATAPEPRANWTFAGCWSRSGAGNCVDIYRDSSGQAWQCKTCGTTKGPGPGKCTPVSQAVLDSGRWCS
jgi:hypothetical protein